MATRKASGAVLSALAPVLPELWGGSADLAGSNDTTMKGEPSFIPAEHQTKMFPGNPYGRTLHFGIREHAMGAILNGIVLHGLTRPYGGTFLVFSDYMRASVRLAALMGMPVTYVWTHDSIGLGEDGPTHQPVEHLWALRAIPGLDVVRPGDANETVVAWRTILEHTDRPAGLCLTRQNLPVLDRSAGSAAWPARRHRPRRLRARRGGRRPARRHPDRAPAARCRSRSPPATCCRTTGSPTRVVSMPCVEWFAEQDAAYREQVLPPAVRARVSVEAGIALGWRGSSGDAGESVSLEHFGASADYQKLYEEFGLTAARAAQAARASLDRAADSRVNDGGPQRRGARCHDVPARRQAGPARATLGVAVWLDDISRERLATGNLADLVRDMHVGRRDVQPDHLRQRAVRGQCLRRAGRRPGACAA